MPLDRASIRKGTFLTSDAGGTCRAAFVETPRNYKTVRELRLEDDERAEQLAAEREALKQRLLDIQSRVAALRKKPS